MGLRRRRTRLTALTAALAAVTVAAARSLVRIEVVGDSMKPTLWPGDRVLALRHCRVAPGDLVVVRDPRHPDRLLVKRVAAVAGDGTGRVTLEGDNPGASTDSRAFGDVEPSAVVGRVVHRYATMRPVPGPARRGVTSGR